MNPRTSQSKAPPAETVADLLEQRARVQGWLDGLEERAEEASPRVVERVREDYTARLQDVMSRLTEHRDSIVADQEAQRQRVEIAEERHEAASESLEEMRLRHLIGELDDDAWEEAEPELATKLSDAVRELQDARGALERLDELIQQIDDGGSAEAVSDRASGEMRHPTPQSPSEPGPEETTEVAGDAIDVRKSDRALTEPLQEIDAAGAVDGPSAEESGNSAEAAGEQEPGRQDDIHFLMELDRALAGADEATLEDPNAGRSGESAPEDEADARTGGEAGENAPPHPNEDEDPELFRPTPGTKCPECGYTNDPDAWYCGVCGVDLV